MIARLRLQFAHLLALLPISTAAQFSVVPLTDAETASYSLDNTPFPTGEGQAARTQYLISASILQQGGLLPGMDVVGMSLMVVDSDAVAPPCIVNMHVAMKNEAGSNLTDFVYSGLAHTADVNPVTLAPGLLTIYFSTPWQWTGPGHNALLEITWEREENAGLNPRILLDTALSYTATYTGRTQEMIPASAITSSYPADVELGSDNSLPAMGLLVQTTTGLGELQGNRPLPLGPNPVHDRLTVQCERNVREFRIQDVSGRVIHAHRASEGPTILDVSTLSHGCYLVSALYTDGGMSVARFIKE